jgi:hypothetical protein
MIETELKCGFNRNAETFERSQVVASNATYQNQGTARSFAPRMREMAMHEDDRVEIITLVQ